MRRLFVVYYALAVAAVLAACTSHAVQNVVPETPRSAQAGSDAVTKVTVTITVATKSAPAEERGPRPHYFSAASRGLLVKAYVHGNLKVIAQRAIDISPGSVACGKKKTTPRTCSATLMLVPSKADDFAIFDYNAKPASGKIPQGSRLVGYGRILNKKIAVSAKKNRFNVFLGGVISRIDSNPAPISFPGDGLDHSVALVVDPVDYGNNPIAAGKNDPYANPIHVNVNETGGTGHTLLSLNGAPGASSVVLKHSTDTVEVEYDGGGAVGYGVRVRLNAGKIKNTGGVTAVVGIAPLLLGSTSADLAMGALALKGNGDYVPIQIGEVNATSYTVFTVSTQHCDAVESTVSLAQSSSSSGSFAVIARGVAATPNPAGCGIVVSDGTSSVPLTVSNTYSGSLGSPTISTAPIPNPTSNPIEITVGPDGALWFAECSGAAIGRVAAGPLGTNAIHEFSLPAANPTPGPVGMYAGPDGNVWFTDQGTGNVGKMTTAGAVQKYPVTAPTDEPSAIAAGSDGNMWFVNWNAHYVGTVPTSGSPLTPYTTGLTGSDASNVALGLDGNLWFTESGANVIGRVTPSGVISEYAIPTAHSDPWGITAGPDGAMWFTECDGGSGNGAIGRIPVTATSGSDIQEFSTGMTGTQPVDVTTGPDGALWFTYWNTAAKVGRITTSGTITEYTIPGASASYNGWGITSAPDGAIWFADDTDNVIGRIAIGSTPAVGHANRVHRTGGSSRYATAREQIRARHYPPKNSSLRP
ncbi:MAG TPA: hypothetical protein VFE36_09875 [Candidatus Baltobacteraceae bacterium]|jgi:virginiamycin B lyase|nr:hypothetical protein [Candidatus Baltobacteraceae bacterium]